MLDRRVFVACMDHMVHCFYKNQKVLYVLVLGRPGTQVELATQKYTLYLPAAITNLEGVQLKR